jgi:hypothetical protein
MLGLSFIALVTAILRIDQFSYVSPFAFLGGGTQYYTVNFFGLLEDVGTLRLVMNTPWAPALGLFGNILFLLCCQDKNVYFRYLGMLSSVILVMGSASRTAVLCLPTVLLLYFLLNRVFKPYFLLLAGTLSFVTTLFLEKILILSSDFIANVKDLRRGSTDNRDTLEKLALDSWWNEAFMWGHGTIADEGPAIVHGLGIGSHHTWYGLLYVHGIVGATVFAIALGWSFWSLLINIGITQYAPLGISLLSVLLIFSFSENIEGLAYLYWPALVMIGIALNEKVNFKNA